MCGGCLYPPAVLADIYQSVPVCGLAEIILGQLSLRLSLSSPHSNTMGHQGDTPRHRPPDIYGNNRETCLHDCLHGWYVVRHARVFSQCGAGGGISDHHSCWSQYQLSPLSPQQKYNFSTELILIPPRAGISLYYQFYVQN